MGNSIYFRNNNETQFEPTNNEHPLPVVMYGPDGVTPALTPDSSGYAKVASDVEVLDFVLVPYSADALDAGDVACTTQEIPLVTRTNGGRTILQSLVFLDPDDTGVACTLVFFSRNVSLGAADSAVSISDTNARQILGTVVVSSFTDLIGCQLATITSIGLVLQAAPESRSIWVSMFTGGAPTYTGAALPLRLGLIRQ